MIGTTGKSVFTSLIEVLAEILVNLRGTLGGLNHHEADGELVDDAFVLQFLPVYLALMMADVDAVDFVALGIADVAIEGAPTEAEGSDEDVVEEVDVDGKDSRSAHPPRPSGQML